MRSTSKTSGRGFTLVEMLIALTLGLLVSGQPCNCSAGR